MVLVAPMVLPKQRLSTALVCCVVMSWSLLAATTYGISKKGASLQVLRSLRMLTILVFQPRYQLPSLIVTVVTNILPYNVCDPVSRVGSRPVFIVY